MNILKKAICIILCVLMMPSSLVAAYADESKFITYNVQSVREYGEKIESKEVAYFDGQNLYVTIDFLTDFTLYYYDNNTTSFVRKGQNSRSKFGRVELNLSDKSATVYMNPLVKKTYSLYNVYKFGNHIFLPLAQMASFLKAYLSIEQKTIRIVNSGYSLADADYAMSILNGKAITNYSINNVIDDIYGGSEAAYFSSSVLSYFGSTIFGLRLSKLDFITNLGDEKNYEDFVEKCVTDNDAYIRALTTNDDLITRFNDVYKLNKDINDYSKEIKDVTSVVKTIAEPFKDSSVDDAMLWINARDWNTFFDVLSSITNIADYYLKFGSMCEDNKKMLNEIKAKSSVEKNGLALHLAIENVQKRYGQNTVNSIMSEIGQELVDKASDKAKNAALETILPSTAAIKITANVFKIMGFDVASDSDYSIMIDLNAKHMLSNDYYNKESSLKYTGSDQTEQYRLSALFFLQACEQVYKSANKLAQKHESGKRYNDETEKIEAVSELYYLAAQSKNFDNFTDVEKNIENSIKKINESGLVNNADSVSQEEADGIILKYKCSIVNKLSQGTWFDLVQYTFPNDGNWENYCFDNKGNVIIDYFIDYHFYDEDDNDFEFYHEHIILTAKYDILNDNKLKFSYDHIDKYITENGNGITEHITVENGNAIIEKESFPKTITLECFENLNSVAAIGETDNGDYYSAWTNEENDNMSKLSNFAKSVAGEWESDYLNKYLASQFVSIYKDGYHDNILYGIYGDITTKDGSIDIHGYSFSDDIVQFTWEGGWVVLEKTKDADILNALIIPDYSAHILEQWRRL